MLLKIANDLIQFTNLNGCGGGECNDDTCKDFNKIATKQYKPGSWPFVKTIPGELKKTDIYDVFGAEDRYGGKPEKKVPFAVCGGDETVTDSKFGFLCFEPVGGKVTDDPRRSKKPNITNEEFANLQKLVVDVFWSEMVKAAGSEYTSSTGSANDKDGIMTYAGYKKWTESAVYSKKSDWTDEDMKTLSCNIKEFANRQVLLQEEAIRARLTDGLPNFGNKKC